MLDSLRTTLGLYGASFAVAFIAGMFPLVSIELFLVGVTAWGASLDVLVALIGIAAAGHQIAKTVTYYAGSSAFALPRGKMGKRIAAARKWIDRWNRSPRLVMFASATAGLPPLYLLGFVARPLMNMHIATFTAISLAGRIGRYATLVAIARLF